MKPFTAVGTGHSFDLVRVAKIRNNTKNTFYKKKKNSHWNIKYCFSWQASFLRTTDMLPELTCPKTNLEPDEIPVTKAWLPSSGLTRRRRPAHGASGRRSAATLAGESTAPAWCPNTPAQLHPSTRWREDPCPVCNSRQWEDTGQWILGRVQPVMWNSY